MLFIAKKGWKRYSRFLVSLCSDGLNNSIVARAAKIMVIVDKIVAMHIIKNIFFKILYIKEDNI